LDPVRLCVMVSGSGTILEVMLESLDVAVVVADRPCRGLEVARGAGVETLLVDRSVFGGFTHTFDRSAFTRVVSEALVERGVDLVAMAGFGTVFEASFFAAFPGRVLNTHPSLLPAFPGWHAVTQTLAAGVSETGCTVHLATATLDHGPVLAQRRVPVEARDDETTLHERIKAVERSLYPRVVGRVMAALAEGREPASVAGTLED
jgi:phosphoribosylglycinamide formyltransferase 1